MTTMLKMTLSRNTITMTIIDSRLKIVDPAARTRRMSSNMESFVREQAMLKRTSTVITYFNPSSSWSGGTSQT